MEKNGSKRLLFEGWYSWRAYTEKSVVCLVKGFFGILYAILAGIATLLYNAILAFKNLAVKNPVCTLSILCFVLSLSLMLSYVCFSAKAKMAEVQRDSIGYELYRIKQALGGDTIVVSGKIKKNNYQN